MGTALLRHELCISGIISGKHSRQAQHQGTAGGHHRYLSCSLVNCPHVRRPCQQAQGQASSELTQLAIPAGLREHAGSHVAISSLAAAMRSSICSEVSVLRPRRRCSRASVLGGATKTKMAFSLLFRTCNTIHSFLPKDFYRSECQLPCSAPKLLIQKCTGARQGLQDG